MKIVLLGCPGAGKGTQAKQLCGKYGFEHISTGDLFRAEIKKQSALGQKVGEYVKKGTLVPDELVVEMVASKLDGIQGGCLLDGFPRTLEQAQELDKYLKKSGQKIDMVIYLAMKEQVVIDRLSSRRTCAKCGEVFNLVSRKPKEEGKCDKCQGELIQREDDTAATVKKRLMVYNDLTQPLVAYYRAENQFHEVDGAGSPQDVNKVMVGIIDQAVAAKS